MPSPASARSPGYRVRRLTLVPLLSATVSGCYTMAGAPMLDLAILGAGAAAMGVSSAAMNASIPSAQIREAEIDTAGNASPEHAQARAYHDRLQALDADENGALPSTLFEVPPGIAGDCDLPTQAAGTLLTQGGFADPGRGAVDDGNVRDTLHSVEGTFIEGDCSDDLPEGPFVAVLGYTQTLLMREVGVETETRYRIRLDGVMTAGELDGEVLQVLESTSNSQNLNNTDYQPPEQIGHASRLGSYDNGEPVGYHVNYTNDYGISRTLVRGFLDDEYATLTTWIGGTRFSTGYMNQASGELDGWLLYQAPGIRGVRECYRNGEMVFDYAYCNELDSQLSDMTPL